MVVAAFVELDLQGDGIEQVRGTAEVGANLEEQAVGAGVDAAAAQVGNATFVVGRKRPRPECHLDPSRGLSAGDIQNVRGDSGERAQRPTKSSGLTGARRSSRPVALRKAATTAAGTTTGDGSPTPFAPYGWAGYGSSMSSETRSGT